MIGGLTALLLATVAPASIAPRDSSEAVAGEFAGKIFIVRDLDKFWEVWEKPEPPMIDTADSVARGKKVTAITVFTGCKPAASGKCDVSIRYSMTGPDGLEYGTAAGGKAWTGAPAPGHNLLASLAALTFELEPADKLGDYQMIARMTDEVSGRTLSLRHTVKAVAD